MVVLCPVRIDRFSVSIKMFSIRTGHLVVLLHISTGCLTFASLQDEMIKANALAKQISSMQNTWINVFNSGARAIDNSCADAVNAVSAAINDTQDWAYQMLDASSKVQSGLMKLNIRDLGMYDECVEINAEYNGLNIKGQHCMVGVVSSYLASAVCVPSSCNESDVAELVNAVIQNVTGIEGLEIDSSAVSCARVESADYTVGEIITILFFSLVAAFILFCTACEFVMISRPKAEFNIVQLLAKFSLYKNGLALLSTECNPKMMPAIQGMRFLSMCWVVVGHRYVTTVVKPLVNLRDVLQWNNSWGALWILVAPFAVDTFFVISGFLMTYLYLKSKKSGKRSNFLMMYIHRYLRLTPALGAVMLFFVMLLVRVTNGPIWESSLTRSINFCRENWWLNLLYVQNFVRADSICLPHAWYLAVDMHLFLISPIILYPLHRWPKAGLGILGLFCAASIVTPAVVLAVNEYSNGVVNMHHVLTLNTSEVIGNFYYYYIVTYNRACGYFVGILLGYYLANRKESLRQLAVAVNWTVACVLMLICGLATHRVYNVNLSYSVIWETIFACTLRLLWSIAMAWVIYACTQGYGGFVTRFLSLPIFLPLSRLSYCIYLVHMVIELARSAAVKTTEIFNDSIILDHFCGDLMLSIVAAFFLSLFFESPVVVLEKILKTPRRRQGRSPSAQQPKTDVEGGIENRGMTELTE